MLAIPTNCTELIQKLEDQAESQRFVSETFRSINPHISHKYKKKLEDTEQVIIKVREAMHSSTFNPE